MVLNRFNEISGLLINSVSAKRSELLNSEQRYLHQKKRLKSLLKHVLLNSRFYKKYYKEHGITLETIEEIELKDLPPINKRIMMDNYDDFVCDSAIKREHLEKFIADRANFGKKYLNKYIVIHTSGSSGTIGFFTYGPRDWSILKALAITRVSKTKINPFQKTKISFIGATDGMYAGISLAQGAPKFLFDLLKLPINSPLDDIITKINDFQPDILSGYSSGNYLLATEQLKGNIRISPKRIICSADSLTSEMRRTIKQAFGLEPVNFYGASESICLGAECELHQGLHLFDDWHCFEFVDEELTPVEPGKSGKLLLTNLYNYTQPLIRYQMNDEIILDQKKCECGLSFPLVKNIAGRREEFLWIEKPNKEKDYIHPIIIVEFFVPGLRKLQVIQTDKNHILMKVVINEKKEVVLPLIHKRMNEIFREKKMHDVVGFDVEVVDSIKNDPKTGKFKLIVPLQKDVSVKGSVQPVK